VGERSASLRGEQQGPGGAGAARRAHASTVLIVDADRVAHRFVELSLANELDVGVEAVNDAAAALDLCRTQNVDVIVAEMRLPDMDGLRFHGRLMQESRLRAVPFVFLSADTRPRTKVVALRAGADDYLCKPCDPGEFAARISALLERQRKRRGEAKNRRYTLAGSLAAVGFPELVGIIEMGQRSGVLSLSGRSLSGEVFFDHGRVVQAYAGTLVGEEAFYRLVWDTDGYFEFTPGNCTLTPDERVITHSAAALIMEGARRFDTARESGQLPAARPATVRPIGPASSWPSAPLLPAPEPSMATARPLELALRESFTLGDLQLFDEKQLAEWTTRPEVRRLHMVLVAARQEGVASLLGLAGTPSESWVIESLRPCPKLLGLSFQPREAPMLDVVLVDADELSLFSASLRRQPAVLIVAPPEGDLMALGTQARVNLKNAVDHLEAGVVLGIGLPTLEAGLTELGIVGTPSRLVCCVRGLLSDASSDLRRVLLHAIRLWLSSGPGGGLAGGGPA
jgi:CheY-like chemotaxis protein